MNMDHNAQPHGGSRHALTRPRVIARSASMVALLWASVAMSAAAVPPIKWERRGAAGGKPLVFIPALGVPGSLWAKVYELLEKPHPVYVVTLAGTDGLPPGDPPHLAATINAVSEMLAAEKLKDPVLIGHLMGANVALHVAAQHPDRVGAVFGIPVVMDRPARSQRAAEAERIVASYLESERDMWVPNMTVQIKSTVKDAVVSQALIDMLSKADRDTYARTLGEMMVDPIEDILPKVQAPVLLSIPISQITRSGNMARQNEQLSVVTKTKVDATYLLYPGLPRCDVVPMRNVSLFPMIDAPDRVAFAIERFLKKLDDPKAAWSDTKRPPTTPSTDGEDSN